jgi:hypothetical protein
MVKLFGISGSPRKAATDWIIREGLKSLYKTVDRLMKVCFRMQGGGEI